MKFNSNPFSSYGKIVTSDQFIGRSREIKKIINRVFVQNSPGNLAIIGEPRMGKSSLIWNTIETIKKLDGTDRTIIIKTIVGEYLNEKSLFIDFVDQCYNEICNEGNFKDVSKDDLSWMESILKELPDYPYSFFSKLKQFFKKVASLNIKIVIVMDEFDYARKLFKSSIAPFQWLRELGYNPDFQITFITASRRTIRNIELQSHAISTLDGIFLKIDLKPFCETDLKEYFSKFTSINIELESQHKLDIIEFCGAHPYLLTTMGYEIVDIYYESKQIDIKYCQKTVEQSFYDYYLRLIDQMKEEDSFRDFIYLLFNKFKRPNNDSIRRFESYGIALKEENGFIAFSNHFQAYLESLSNLIGLSDLLTITELYMRILIERQLMIKYKPNWEEITSRIPSYSRAFSEAKLRRDNEIKSKGEDHILEQTTILDYVYIKTLFEICTREWEMFEKILGKTKQYWADCGDLLVSVRNPFFHHRVQVLNKTEMLEAEEYCNTVIQICEKSEI